MILAGHRDGAKNQSQKFLSGKTDGAVRWDETKLVCNVD